ncbi:MAG: GIY-YIG nuclease family protein [Parcubacteria group bacterium]|jgi:excinuclease ABC subunit C
MQMMSNNNIKKLSSNSGVYIFKDKTGIILYIGKATNLKNRVSSYFNGRIENRPVQYAISQIAKIETRETDSVLEALILEANLIKKYQPKYNVDLKDDKSFSYAVITKEKFPRILIFRRTDLEKNKNIIKYNYGPYTSKKQLEIALKIIRKIFPYHSLRQQTEKGCLDYQIGLCPGPHAGAISRKEYLKNIRNIKMILEGKKKSLVKKMEKEMQDFSKKYEFEKAGEIRNKIFALNHIRDIALISKDEQLSAISNQSLNIRLEAYDISNISGQYAVGSMVVFKNNEPDKSQYRKFKIKTVSSADDVGMMKEVLMRRFNNNWPKPDLILLDGGQGHLSMYDKLARELKLEIPVIAVAKGPTRKISNFQFLISKQFPISKFSNDLKNIINDKNLLGRITSEAHRFAIAYHKKVRRKSFI